MSSTTERSGAGIVSTWAASPGVKPVFSRTSSIEVSGYTAIRRACPLGIEVEQAEFGHKPLGAIAAMAELLCRPSVSSAMAEIGDEIAVLDQTESAPALGVFRGTMGRGPKGDMGGVAGQIAAAAAAGQFQRDIRIAQRSNVAVAPSVDL